MAELRVMRSECGQLETQLSYARRIVQGRLDIVEAERHRRAQGLAPSNVSELVASLPSILATRGAGQSQHRIRDDQGLWVDDDVEVMSDTDQLTGVPSLTDEGLAEVALRLVAYERDVSGRRRLALNAYDILSAEVVRRFRTGEASIEAAF